MAGIIGLLTGTFDPPHLGHVGLSRAALSAGGLNEVWWLVNAHPGHKTGAVPYNHRRIMAELTVAGEPKMRVALSSDSARPHTMEGFMKLMAGYPDQRFVFIVGMDTLVRLPTWDGFETVVKKASFMVAHRPTTSVGAVERVRHQLGPLGRQLRVQLFEFAVASEASSTSIRRQLRVGQRPALVSEAVIDYALEQRLYR